MKDQTFSGYRPYNSEPLESMLKESLGTDTTMADITHPKLVLFFDIYIFLFCFWFSLLSFKQMVLKFSWINYLLDIIMWIKQRKNFEVLHIY